jgi:hypothetical protein
MTGARLSPKTISEILETVEDAQANTRATLARWLRVQGYEIAALSAPSSHILERLTVAREAENELFRAIHYGDADRRVGRPSYYNPEVRREYEVRKRRQANGAGAD